jgi:hypothetical protein
MVPNSTGVVSVSMEIFNYGCLVTTAFSQIRHNIQDTVMMTTGVFRGVPHFLLHDHSDIEHCST